MLGTGIPPQSEYTDLKLLQEEAAKRSRVDTGLFPVFHTNETAARVDDIQWNYSPQSGVTSDTSVLTDSNSMKQHNMKFSDQNAEYVNELNCVMDESRKLQDTDDIDLSDFFSRPVKINQTSWGTGTILDQTIDPWSLYFNNKRVANRLVNYKLLRATLHIKVVVNGNGFLYGRAMATYLPLADFDDFKQTSSLIPQTLIQMSQWPKVFIDPRNSTAGTLVVPMFWHNNVLDVSFGNFNDVGELYLRSIVPLKHANGASDFVTVSVFAWAEDVQLSGLTAYNFVGLTPQSGKEVDVANSSGVVSGPATAIAKFAGALKTVPTIGKYAMATEMGANVVANVARQMGYCRPPLTRNPDPLKPTMVSSLALCTVPDGVQKLSVDDKQELTIDPDISGLHSSDPMAIVEIAKRESYITQFTWQIGAAPDDFLWNCRVTPMIWDESASGAYHFPACAAAALPFTKWTGTMHYRFQVVCSAFHKGRLKILYDPVQTPLAPEWNVNYMRIVDISDETDFTVSVSNTQSQTLLNMAIPGLDSSTETFSTTPYTSYGPGNGTLAVYVVNELTTPNSSVNNDIQINVYVSAGDDFEVFYPTDLFQRFVFKPQSGMERIPESENTTEPDAPQQSIGEHIGVELSHMDVQNIVFAGESVRSFRTLLKRYNLHSVIAAATTTTTNLFLGTRPAFPYYRGNVAGAVDTTSASAPYNFCNTVLLHWVRIMFSGARGSIRWKLVPRRFSGGFSSPVNIMVQRDDFALDYEQDVAASNSYTSVTQAKKDVILAGVMGTNIQGNFTATKGAAITNSSVNPSLEFEVPYYAAERFEPGKPQSYTQNGLYYFPTWKYLVNTAGATKMVVDAYCAAGEDFQVYFFTGMPPVYYEESPPEASPS